VGEAARLDGAAAAAAVFFATAFVYSHSGKGGDRVPASSALNMVSVIAEASAAGTHGSAT
jgi:hypothetical protein